MAAPIALTIAGSDSSGGAGIQADLKTFSALGVYGASVIVALTAQNTRGVTAIHDVPPDFIAAQIDAVMTDLAVGAIKIGMVSQATSIEAIAAGLDRHRAKTIVIDPVMVAASGARLLSANATDALIEHLLPRATLLTPNIPEAAALLGVEEARSVEEMEAQGWALQVLGARSVLVKGGHGDGPYSIDVLIDASGVATRLSAPRSFTRNTHGTGCTLSSAIAAGLAKGATITGSVREAKEYVGEAIAAADGLHVGKGHGPVHHFVRWWDARANTPPSLARTPYES